MRTPWNSCVNWLGQELRLYPLEVLLTIGLLRSYITLKRWNWEVYNWLLQVIFGYKIKKIPVLQSNNGDQR